MRHRKTRRSALAGFIAGFVATLIAHQLALTLLWALGIAPFEPFNMAATEPLGVPAVISLAFWGGVWGIIFAVLQPRFPRRYPNWLVGAVFGAVVPTLVALLIVVPLKGGPVGAGWQPAVWLTAVLINGAWGLGTALLLPVVAPQLKRWL